MLGREIDRLIGRIAEEIVEKSPDAAAKRDAGHACEQAALPGDSDRHVEDNLAALAALEQPDGPRAEPSAARCVKDQRMRVDPMIYFLP
jgi:hypothetical protein